MLLRLLITAALGAAGAWALYKLRVPAGAMVGAILLVGVFQIRHGGGQMDYKKLGNRIREERRRLNLTQAQLAEDIDISDTYMGAIERGERSLTLDTLERLVNRFGVTIDYLLADSIPSNDSIIIEQFKQIIDRQPLERKQMAINVLHSIFSYFEKEGS